MNSNQYSLRVLITYTLLSVASAFSLGYVLGRYEINPLRNPPGSDRAEIAKSAELTKKPSPGSQIPQSITNVGLTSPSNLNMPQMTDDLIDMQSLYNTVQGGLASDDLENRKSAIIFLAQYGSEKAKSFLRRMASEEPDPQLRATAILISRWDIDPDSLLGISIDEKDPYVKVAIISAVNSAELDVNYKSKFAQLFYDSLSYELDSDVINRILSYFHGQNQDLLVNAYRILLSRDLPPGVLDHMRDLARGSSYLIELFPNLIQGG